MAPLEQPPRSKKYLHGSLLGVAVAVAVISVAVDVSTEFEARFVGFL